jgi:hypothetical protein
MKGLPLGMRGRVYSRCGCEAVVREWRWRVQSYDALGLRDSAADWGTPTARLASRQTLSASRTIATCTQVNRRILFFELATGDVQPRICRCTFAIITITRSLANPSFPRKHPAAAQLTLPSLLNVPQTDAQQSRTLLNGSQHGRQRVQKLQTQL